MAKQFYYEINVSNILKNKFKSLYIDSFLEQAQKILYQIGYGIKKISIYQPFETRKWNNMGLQNIFILQQSLWEEDKRGLEKLGYKMILLDKKEYSELAEIIKRAEESGGNEIFN